MGKIISPAANALKTERIRSRLRILAPILGSLSTTIIHSTYIIFILYTIYIFFASISTKEMPGAYLRWIA